LGQWERLDDAIVDTEKDIEGAKSEIRNAEEAESRIWGEVGKEFGDKEGKEGEGKGEGERKERFPAEEGGGEEGLEEGIAEDDPDFPDFPIGANGEVGAKFEGENACGDE
jgi:hypothetical protein